MARKAKIDKKARTIINVISNMPYFRIDETKDIGHEPEYYADRDIQFDGRGEVHISPLSKWGVGVMVITASHEPISFDIVYRPVIVKEFAWICSGAILYNCTIGVDAIVAAGTVVRSRDVPDEAMVEGNPARIIAWFVKGKWQYLDEAIELRRKK